MCALAQYGRKLKYVTISECINVSDSGVLQLLSCVPNLELVLATGIESLSQEVKDKLKRLERSLKERGGD